MYLVKIKIKTNLLFLNIRRKIKMKLEKDQKTIIKMLGLDIEGKELEPQEVASLFKHFKLIEKTIKDYGTKVLRPFFFKGAEEFGEETQSGGHRYVGEDGYGWEKQARVKVTVDDDKALELLKEKRLYEFIDVEETISEDTLEEVIKVLKQIGREDLISKDEKVSHESLEQLYLNGKITDEELSDIIDRKVTYALVEVKPKKK